MKNLFKSKKVLVSLIILVSILAFGFYFWSGRNGRFVRTGDMTISREYHTATLLKDGRVLIAGGFSDALNMPITQSYLKSAEIYDPKTSKFTRTVDMNVARANHTATLLNDGEVLIVGGENYPNDLSSAEIYNPKTSKFVFVGRMHLGRSNHTATLLNDGRVLIVGGSTNFNSKYNKNKNVSELQAEIYDPKTGQFSLTSKMLDNIYSNTSILLPNGKVLIINGIDKKVVQIFNPLSNSFSDAGIIPTKYSGFYIGNLHSIILDKNTVFIMNSLNSNDFYLYDINHEKFSQLKNNTETKCSETSPCTITALKNNKVLITGLEQKKQLIFDSTKKVFEYTPTINQKVNLGQKATLLKNGNVLLTGGLIEYRPNYSIFTMFHRHRKHFKISNKAELFKY